MKHSASQTYIRHHQVTLPIQLRLLELIDENKILLSSDKDVQFQIGIVSQKNDHLVQLVR